MSSSDSLQSSEHNNKNVIMSPRSITGFICILWSGNPTATGLLNYNLNTTATSPVLTPYTFPLASCCFQRSVLCKLAVGATVHSLVCFCYPIPLKDHVFFRVKPKAVLTQPGAYLYLPAAMHLTHKYLPSVAPQWRVSEWAIVKIRLCGLTCCHIFQTVVLL